MPFLIRFSCIDPDAHEVKKKKTVDMMYKFELHLEAVEHIDSNPRFPLSQSS